jgi:hypothetical protein
LTPRSYASEHGGVAGGGSIVSNYNSFSPVKNSPRIVVYDEEDQVESSSETCPYLVVDVRDVHDYVTGHITSASSLPAMNLRQVFFELYVDECYFAHGVPKLFSLIFTYDNF